MSEIKILLVEDDQSLAKAIQRRLEAKKCTVVATASGKEALELVTADMESFDGIWLDFDIHYYNGHQFMELFTKNSGWKKIPVVVVSNTGDSEQIEKTLALGAKKFIIKAEVRLDDITEKFLSIVAPKKKPSSATKKSKKATKKNAKK